MASSELSGNRRPYCYAVSGFTYFLLVALCLVFGVGIVPLAASKLSAQCTLALLAITTGVMAVGSKKPALLVLSIGAITCISWVAVQSSAIDENTESGFDKEWWILFAREKRTGLIACLSLIEGFGICWMLDGILNIFPVLKKFSGSVDATH